MTAPRRPTKAQLEALFIEHAGNLSRVARALGCSRTTLYTWTYQLGLAERVGIRATPPPAPGDRVTCSVKLPAELWRWARIEAIDWDTTPAAVVEEALEALRGIRAAAVADIRNTIQPALGETIGRDHAVAVHAATKTLPEKGGR